MIQGELDRTVVLPVPPVLVGTELELERRIPTRGLLGRLEHDVVRVVLLVLPGLRVRPKAEGAEVRLHVLGRQGLARVTIVPANGTSLAAKFLFISLFSLLPRHKKAHQ